MLIISRKILDLCFMTLLICQQQNDVWDEGCVVLQRFLWPVSSHPGDKGIMVCTEGCGCGVSLVSVKHCFI